MRVVYATLIFFVRAGRSNRSYGNVAIKREQRLLADYAEREQRKDCEAGLIIGIMGIEESCREDREFKEFKEFKDCP